MNLEEKQKSRRNHNYSQHAGPISIPMANFDRETVHEYEAIILTGAAKGSSQGVKTSRQAQKITLECLEDPNSMVEAGGLTKTDTQIDKLEDVCRDTTPERNITIESPLLGNATDRLRPNTVSPDLSKSASFEKVPLLQDDVVASKSLIKEQINYEDKSKALAEVLEPATSLQVKSTAVPTLKQEANVNKDIEEVAKINEIDGA